MNYFELFQLPVQLKPDKNEVRKKYLELSKKNHPDFFATAGAEHQQNAIETSASLNKALKTLSNGDDTIRYVLQLKGLLEDEEKYSLAPDFLMQMMEVNEELAEMGDDSDPNHKIRLQQQLNELEKDVYDPVAYIIENYQEGVTPEEELLQVKDYYFKKKYINRLRQQFGEKL
jgi:molecular chaperone HscB